MKRSLSSVEVMTSNIHIFASLESNFALANNNVLFKICLYIHLVRFKKEKYTLFTNTHHIVYVCVYVCVFAGTFYQYEDPSIKLGECPLINVCVRGIHI